MKIRSDSLRDLVPAVRRARGFRLYDARGRRYLDLSLDNGLAVLGHRPLRLQQEVKAVISKTGFSPLPSAYPLRLARALTRAYPGYGGVRIAAGEAEAVALAARYLECGPAEVEIRDPALGETGRVVRDRPFLPAAQREQALQGAEVVIPAIPFRVGGSPCAILFRGQAPEAEQAWIPPMAAAAALRALHDLARHTLPAWYSDDLLAGCKAWVQRGIYVAPSFDPGRYAGAFARFLEQGVLLPPEYPGPAVLPGEASEGELALLKRLFGEDV